MSIVHGYSEYLESSLDVINDWPREFPVLQKPSSPRFVTWVVSPTKVMTQAMFRDNNKFLKLDVLAYGCIQVCFMAAYFLFFVILLVVATFSSGAVGGVPAGLLGVVVIMFSVALHRLCWKGLKQESDKISECKVPRGHQYNSQRNIGNTENTKNLAHFAVYTLVGMCRITFKYFSMYRKQWYWLMPVLSGCTVHVHHEVPLSISLLAHTKTAANSQFTFPAEPPLSTIISNQDLLEMNVVNVSGDSQINVYDAIKLSISTSVDAYLNCYYHQSNNDIVRIYPGYASLSQRVYSGSRITLPDSQEYHFIADRKNDTEGFMCLISSEELLSRLPAIYQSNGFQPLPIDNFDHIYELYRGATVGNLLGRSVFYVAQYR